MRAGMAACVPQAEDGIRDADVTGVQTCALPICSRRMSALVAAVLVLLASAVLWNLFVRPAPRARSPATPESQVESRSEERRVGKEGRYPWSPYRYKKRYSKSRAGGRVSAQHGRG